MPVTYIPSSNASTSGVALGAANQDIWIKKLIIGNPVNSGNIGIYNITNPLPSFNAANAASLLFKYTYEGSVGGSSLRVIDFTTNSPAMGDMNTESMGIRVDGGNVMIDQNMQVTVIWDTAGGAVL